MLIVAGGLAASAVAWRGPSADASHALAPGDRAVVHVVVHRGDGLPLFATREEEARTLADTTGSPTLVGAHRPAFGEAEVEAGAIPLAPGDLTRLFSDELVGKRVGDRFETRVHTRPFGGWDESLVLDRVIGPLPMTPEVPTAVFRRSYPDAREGDVIHLSAGFQSEARIVSIDDATTSYRNLFEDGQQIVFSRIGVPGTILLHGDGTFSVRLHPEPGQIFVVRGSCGKPFYELAPGSYRVAALDDDAIVLDHNPVPYPSLIEQDAYASVEIIHLVRTPVEALIDHFTHDRS